MTGLTALGVRAFAVGVAGGLIFAAGVIAGLALAEGVRR